MYDAGHDACALFEGFAVPDDVLGVLESVLFGRGQGAILESDVLCVVHLDAFFDTIETNAIEEQVMNGQTFQTSDVHCRLRVHTGDVTEGEIAPMGIELRLVVTIGSAASTSRTVCITGLEEDSRFADIFHSDVVAIDVFTPTSTTRSRFETATDVGTIEHTIFDDETLHTTAELRTDDKSTVCTVHGIVGDEEIALRTSFYTFVSNAAFHTDTIVTSADMTTGDEGYLYVTRVHGIAVLRPPRTIDRHVLDDEVLDTGRHEVKFRAVAKGHTLYYDVLRVGDVNQVRTHLLLDLRSSCDIRDAQLLVEVEWIPEAIGLVVLFERTAECQSLFPYLRQFAVTNDFLLFDRTPDKALTVNHTLTGDTDVLQFGATDERVAFLAAVAQAVVFLDVQLFVLGAQDSSAFTQMEVDVTAELDRSGFPYAAWHDDVSAALLGELFDGFVESLGTIGFAVRHCAILGDVD